jgi:hypothetical protein
MTHMHVNMASKHSGIWHFYLRATAWAKAIWNSTNGIQQKRNKKSSEQAIHYERPSGIPQIFGVSNSYEQPDLISHRHSKTTLSSYLERRVNKLLHSFAQTVWEPILCWYVHVHGAMCNSGLEVHTSVLNQPMQPILHPNFWCIQFLVSY